MKVSDAKELGQVIRARRRGLDYTQADLAEHTGFSVSFISDLERGKQTCEIGKTLYLISVLGLDVEIKGRGADA